MIDVNDLKLEELHRLIAKLPPGRARRKYEETLRGLLGRVEPNDDKQDTAPISDPKNDDVSIERFSLVVTRVAATDFPRGLVQLNSWTTIIDVPKYVDCTLADLAAYVAARNKGRIRHWAEDLLDEKVAGLRLCGVEAEIREIH
jgi:hypothetical protein